MEQLPRRQPNLSVVKRQELKENRMSLSQMCLSVTKKAVAIHKQLSLSQGDSPVAKRPAVQSNSVSPNRTNGLIAKQPNGHQTRCAQQSHCNAESPVAIETDLLSSRSSSPVAEEPATDLERVALSQGSKPVSKQTVVDITDLPSSPKEVRARSPAKQPDVEPKGLSSNEGSNPVSKQPANIQRFLHGQGVPKSPRIDAELFIEDRPSASHGNSPVTKEAVAKAKRLSLSQGNSPVTKQPVNMQRFLLGQGLTKSPRQNADLSTGRRLSLSQGNSPVTKQPVTRAKRLSLSQAAKGGRSLNQGNNNPVAKRPVPKIKRLQSSQENGQKFKQKSLFQFDFIKSPKGRSLMTMVLTFEYALNIVGESFKI